MTETSSSEHISDVFYTNIKSKCLKENKDPKDNKEEIKEIELVLEPVKIDGYCFRTIKEDQSIDENEKPGTKDKKGAKKK